MPGGAQGLVELPAGRAGRAVGWAGCPDQALGGNPWIVAAGGAVGTGCVGTVAWGGVAVGAW